MLYDKAYHVKQFPFDSDISQYLLVVNCCRCRLWRMDFELDTYNERFGCQQQCCLLRSRYRLGLCRVALRYWMKQFHCRWGMMLHIHYDGQWIFEQRWNCSDRDYEKWLSRIYHQVHRVTNPFQCQMHLFSLLAPIKDISLVLFSHSHEFCCWCKTITL